MINLFSNANEDKQRKIEILRIKGLIEDELGFRAQSYLIKVTQLDHCPDPECESIETLIVLFKEGSPPLQFRYSCLMSEITKETIENLLIVMKKNQVP